MWPNFDGKPYTRDAIAARIASLDWSKWTRKDGSHGKPSAITLHNTSNPNLALWQSWSPAKRQQYILNLQPYYEGMKPSWKGGPHFFVTPQDDAAIFGFNDLMAAGTHASCFNFDHIGIEMIGDFDTEPFDSGDGAKVRDNAVFLMAALHTAIGLNPRGLTFHVECKADNHDCPGKNVNKSAMIGRVSEAMSKMFGAPDPQPVPPPPVVDQLNVLSLQTKLQALGFDPGGLDGKMGDRTKAALVDFAIATLTKETSP